MKKNKIVISLVLASLLVGGGVRYALNNNRSNMLSQGASVWKEVSINDEMYVASASLENFDLKETITESDYVFSGTVVNREEYEVEWVDDNGEQWGPFPSSVIEVKINKEYYGTSPVKDDIIRVYYPYSFSVAFKGSFLIKDNSEYVFVTRALDEKFVEQREKENPDDKFEQEKYADVYISNAYYSLLPVDNEMVFMNHDYFGWNEDVMKKTESSEYAQTDKVTSSEVIENGWVIALNENDFDNSFSELFENQEELPDAIDLSNLHEEEIE